MTTTAQVTCLLFAALLIGASKKPNLSKIYRLCLAHYRTDHFSISTIALMPLTRVTTNITYSVIRRDF